MRGSALITKTSLTGFVPLTTKHRVLAIGKPIARLWSVGFFYLMTWVHTASLNGSRTTEPSTHGRVRPQPLVTSRVFPDSLRNRDSYGAAKSLIPHRPNVCNPKG